MPIYFKLLWTQTYSYLWVLTIQGSMWDIYLVDLFSFFKIHLYIYKKKKE